MGKGMGTYPELGIAVARREKSLRLTMTRSKSVTIKSQSGMPWLSSANVASDTPNRSATAHGFRSRFRDWPSENGYSRDLVERALGHTIRNAVEAADHRTDLLEERREMMYRWDQTVTEGHHLGSSKA